MESIDILTGQYVTIKLEPASIISRMFALFLDYFFVTIYFFAILYSFIELGEKVDTHISRDMEITLLIIFWIPAFAYHFLFESILGGRTPGKMIVGIKVTNADGTPPSILAYFLRWVLMPIDLFPSGGIGVLCILLSARHQRVGDMAAGTVVVKINRSLKLDLDELYFEFPTDYRPTFQESELLSEGQIAFISNLLINPANKATSYESIRTLTQKVKNILKIESGLDDRTFLETIVKDYNYYASLEI